MLQMIALAITCFARFVFNNLTVRFMPPVLGEEFVLVGNPAKQVPGDLDALSQDLQLPIADQCLVDQARKYQIIRLHAFKKRMAA
jgi:hypothetical protein